MHPSEGDIMKQRIVVWGTGVVGSMIVAELTRDPAHPAYELVGVGVSNPDKVGRDVGEIWEIGRAHV